MQSSHDAYSSRYSKNIGAEKCEDLCLHYFKDLLEKEDCIFYVATSSGILVGMIIAHFRTRPPVYEVSQEVSQNVEVEVAVVDQTHRRRGIFRRLLESVEEKARLAGVEMVEIIIDYDNSTRRMDTGC